MAYLLERDYSSEVAPLLDQMPDLERLVAENASKTHMYRMRTLLKILSSSVLVLALSACADEVTSPPEDHADVSLLTLHVTAQLDSRGDSASSQWNRGM